MSKPTATMRIHLDLLRPQSKPEKLPARLMRWLLSTGRLIFIVVEALVLIVFVARFKIDADIQSKKEAIDQQIPYINTLRPYERLIKSTQLKLSTIGAFKQTQAEYSKLLQEISDQTPLGIKIINLGLEKGVGKVAVKINGEAQTNNDVAAFIAGLKSNRNFSDIILATVSIEAGMLHFTTNLTAKFEPVRAGI